MIATSDMVDEWFVEINEVVRAFLASIPVWVQESLIDSNSSKNEIGGPLLCIQNSNWKVGSSVTVSHER
jgi:hypothetical protein